jgi:hypothetical protein
MICSSLCPFFGMSNLPVSAVRGPQPPNDAASFTWFNFRVLGNSSTASTNATAAFNFQRGRAVFFRGLGIAFPIASHHPPVNAQLLGHSGNRTYAEPVLSTDLLEQPHLGSPVQRVYSASGFARIRVPVRLQGGPKQTAELDQIRIPKSTELVTPPTTR